MAYKPLYVALAQRKEDRKAHLNQQYMQRNSGLRLQVWHQGCSYACCCFINSTYTLLADAPNDAIYRF